MKTLRISDDIHQKLTALLGELMAQTSKMQTYQDAIEAMLYQSVIMPPELLSEVERFIQTHRGRGYTTKEEFIRQAVRFMLKWESGEYEFVEIPREDYERLNKAVKEMNTPYTNAEDFIRDQIRKALEKYEEWFKERGEKET
ncbi:MAG: ribbon-helix-helix domain-containing protein [Nitrososphaerota archaeon]|nr:ribbon-helix-helix domain-containing protein [Candidatus Bathyarchaeota archaeon]MDW8023392.1 ribbon-helix-helix domain-containing protein [Nitrososphaerota archaeon]